MPARMTHRNNMVKLPPARTKLGVDQTKYGRSGIGECWRRNRQENANGNLYVRSNHALHLLLADVFVGGRVGREQMAEGICTCKLNTFVTSAIAVCMTLNCK